LNPYLKGCSRTQEKGKQGIKTMRKDNKKLITKARAELKRGEISRQTYLLLIEHLVEAEKIIAAATTVFDETKGVGAVSVDAGLVMNG